MEDVFEESEEEKEREEPEQACEEHGHLLDGDGSGPDDCTTCEGGPCESPQELSESEAGKQSGGRAGSGRVYRFHDRSARGADESAWGPLHVESTFTGGARGSEPEDVAVDPETAVQGEEEDPFAERIRHIEAFEARFDRDWAHGDAPDWEVVAGAPVGEGEVPEINVLEEFGDVSTDVGSSVGPEAGDVVVGEGPEPLVDEQADGTWSASVLGEAAGGLGLGYGGGQGFFGGPPDPLVGPLGAQLEPLDPEEDMYGDGGYGPPGGPEGP